MRQLTAISIVVFLFFHAIPVMSCGETGAVPPATGTHSPFRPLILLDQASRADIPLYPEFKTPFLQDEGGQGADDTWVIMRNAGSVAGSTSKGHSVQWQAYAGAVLCVLENTCSPPIARPYHFTFAVFLLAYLVLLYRKDFSGVMATLPSYYPVPDQRNRDFFIPGGLQ